jgi:aconitate hydratase
MMSPVEGGFTKYYGSEPGAVGTEAVSSKVEEMSIYDAAMKYREDGVPLVIFAGKEYGTGSSRDWAAKGTMLMGVKAVVAESFERIHRSNLVGMGVLPLQFKEGQSAASLSIDGTESFDLLGVETGEVKPRMEVTLKVTKTDGSSSETPLVLRIDTPIEVEYYKAGGILPFVLRQLLSR